MESVLILPKSIKRIKWKEDAPSYIHITGEITEESMAQFELEFRAASKSQDVVPIIIDSTGGNIYSAFRAVDLIAKCKAEVVTVALGTAMSAAALIFSCGERRFAAPNCTIMMHDVSATFLEGKSLDIEIESKELKRVNESMWRLFDENCGTTKGFFKNRSQNSDCYLSAMEALQCGLATAIGLPKLKTEVYVHTTFEDYAETTKKRKITLKG